jgi:hypothetical protein
MVDFTKTVTVVVAKNPKAKFEGVLNPSVDTMLKDQLFLGRGWRYFTAFVDLELRPQPATRPTRPATRGSITVK